MNSTPFIAAWSLIILVLTSCNPTGPTPVLQTQSSFPQVETASPIPSLTQSPKPTPVTPLPTPTSSETPAPSPTQTATRTPTETATLTPIPTYAILRGEILELSNCRYGPGFPYLYKYALIPGSNLEIIGRNELGTWILVRAIGGTNPCWVKASLMDVKGGVMAVEPTYIPLPQSPYYGPPGRVSASRDGDEVSISWIGIQLRAGDDSEQFPYLIEAWVCEGGKLIFTPVGSYATAVKIVDEQGCPEPSHGRLYAVEKHGYTRWVEIPWPARD